MKSSSSNIQKFLQSQISPCVLCFASPVILEKFPDYHIRLLSIWNKVTSDSNFPVRLLFYDQLPDLNKVKQNMSDYYSLNPKSQPYDFFKINPRNAKLNVRPLLRLTKQLISLDYMTPYSFFDIPISLLALVLDNEKHVINTTHLPNWMKPYLPHVKSNLLKFQISDEELEEKLNNYHSNILFKRYQTILSENESNYQQHWVGWRQNLQELIGNKSESDVDLITLKFYADIHLAQCHFSLAHSYYHQLILNLNPTKRIFLTQAHYYIAINDIIHSKVTQQTIEHLNTASEYSTTSLSRTKCYLLNFWARTFITNANVAPIIKIITLYKNSLTLKLIKPFCYEFIAMSLNSNNNRKKALMYGIAATYFDDIKFNDEFALKCFWFSYNLICSYSSWNLIITNLLMKILSFKNLPKDVEFNQCLGKLMESKQIYYIDELLNYLKRYPSNDYFICGFMKSNLDISLNNGSMMFPPPSLRNANWLLICEKLFGSFTKGKFFTFKNFGKIECGVGETVYLKVSLSSAVSGYPINDIKLLTSGIKNVQLSSYTINKKSVKDIIELSFTPLETGVLTIYGISFSFAGLINLKSLFTENTLKYNVQDQAPQINIQSEPISTSLFVGETLLLNVKIINGEIPLQHLAVLIQSQINVILYDPQFEEICGQTFLPNLKSNEEIELKFAIHADKEGKFNLTLLFPFWTSNSHQPLYKFLSYDFNVSRFEMQNHVITRTSYELSCPDGCKPIGIYSPDYNASMFVQNVFNDKLYVEFVTRKHEREVLKLPEYVEVFRSKSKLSFWFKTECGYVEYPMDNFNQCVFCLYEYVGKDMFVLTVRNISNYVLTDMKVTLMSPLEDLCFVVSGVAMKIVERLEPGNEFKIKFNFVQFVPGMFPSLLVACDQFAFNENIKLVKNGDVY